MSEQAVIRGEGLDIGAVDAWLKTRLPELRGKAKVTQFSGGASNWTYLLSYPDRDLVLRRPPAGVKAASAHDMAREYNIQARLKPVFPAAPGTIGLCQDPSVLGCDFYVMERLVGIIPRANFPRGVSLDRTETRRLCETMLETLVALHAVDFRAVGLGRLYKGDGYVGRQVEGWSRRYVEARTWNVPSFRTVRDWLAKTAPPDAGVCLIHNDWRFDNLVLDQSDPTQVIGVLDWELATVGDPLMELGSMLAYWVEAGDGPIMRATRRQPTDLPGMMTRQDVVDFYLARSGLRPENWTFYEVFGLFRLAVIAQQIYYRFHHRQSRNPAFKNFWLFVHFLDHRAKRLIARSPR